MPRHAGREVRITAAGSCHRRKKDKGAPRWALTRKVHISDIPRFPWRLVSTPEISGRLSLGGRGPANASPPSGNQSKLWSRKAKPTSTCPEAVALSSESSRGDGQVVHGAVWGSCGRVPLAGGPKNDSTWSEGPASGDTTAGRSGRSPHAAKHVRMTRASAH